jgi:hypothetical protein
MAKQTQTIDKRQFHFIKVEDGRVQYRVGKGDKVYSRRVMNDDAVAYMNHRGFRHIVDVENKTLTCVANGQPLVSVVAVTPSFTKEQLERMELGLANPIEGTNYLLTDGIKICKCCNEGKEATQYHNNKNSKDGLDTTCKSCKSKRAKAAKKVAEMA